MKSDNNTFILVFILLIFTMSVAIGNDIERNNDHKESMQKIDSLYQVMQNRYIIDSLYHTHMSQCNFELREGIISDSDN